MNLPAGGQGISNDEVNRLPFNIPYSFSLFFIQ